ncbi:MAG: SipW-dependent-type signal peptide-containing protein [Micrococcales bacterium]|nr:SipW-dependent-type signal peptide-containing protein [Micrococcales bacterium]
MNTPNTRRQRRVKGFVSGAAGVALLLAGGTWALWSDQASLGGGVVAAGNLELGGGDAQLFDVSRGGAYNMWNVYQESFSPRADQTETVMHWMAGSRVNEDQLPCFGTGPHWGHIPGDRDPIWRHGHPIDDIKAWNMVPGDRVTIVWPLEVALQGDNLVAELALGLPSLNTTNGLDNIELAVWTDGIKTEIPTDQGGSYSILLQADSQPGGSRDVDPATGLEIPVVTKTSLGAGAAGYNVCVALGARFDPDTQNRDLVLTKLLEIQDSPVTLTQVRTPGIGHFQ